jgi:hypothetical protein
MQKLFVGTLTAAVMLVWSAVPSLAQNSFKPAEVTSTPYIQSPTLIGEPRVVVLNVALDNEGEVTGIIVVSDIPSLTSVATSSIHTWKFAPASTHGVPEASVSRVAFVFLPHGFSAVGPSSLPKHSDGNPDRIDNQGYIPPDIVSVAYPRYPFNAAAPGAVVIQATINESGTIRYLDVLRDLRPFTQFALSAMNRWRFQAATLEGKPRVSNLAIAFVFAPPTPTD